MWCCGRQKLQEEETATGALETITEEGVESKGNGKTSNQQKKQHPRTSDESKKIQKKRKAKPMTSTSTITTTLSIASTGLGDHPDS